MGTDKDKVWFTYRRPAYQLGTAQPLSFVCRHGGGLGPKSLSTEAAQCARLCLRCTNSDDEGCPPHCCRRRCTAMLGAGHPCCSSRRCPPRDLSSSHFMVKCMECATIAPRRLERHVLTDGCVPLSSNAPWLPIAGPLRQASTGRLHPARCDAPHCLEIMAYSVVVSRKSAARNRQPRVVEADP